MGELAQDDSPKKKIKVQDVCPPSPPPAVISVSTVEGMTEDEWAEVFWTEADEIMRRMGGGYKVIPTPVPAPIEQFIVNKEVSSGAASAVPSGVSQDPSNPCPTHGPCGDLSVRRTDSALPKAERVVCNPDGYL